jgi:hypothetical protein
MPKKVVEQTNTIPDRKPPITRNENVREDTPLETLPKELTIKQLSAMADSLLLFTLEIPRIKLSIEEIRAEIVVFGVTHRRTSNHVQDIKRNTEDTKKFVSDLLERLRKLEDPLLAKISDSMVPLAPIKDERVITGKIALRPPTSPTAWTPGIPALPPMREELASSNELAKYVGNEIAEAYTLELNDPNTPQTVPPGKLKDMIEGRVANALIRIQSRTRQKEIDVRNALQAKMEEEKRAIELKAVSDKAALELKIASDKMASDKKRLDDENAAKLADAESKRIIRRNFWLAIIALGCGSVTTILAHYLR